VLYRPFNPISRQSDSRAIQLVVKKEKRTLSRAAANVSEFTYVAVYIHDQMQEYYPASLSPLGATLDSLAGIAAVHGVNLWLRIDSLMINCCNHETFLHIGLQVSHLNICYSPQDLH